MKLFKLSRCALIAILIAAFGFAGCEGLDLYSIDAPADLQSQIDSIAAAKAGVDTGDTTFVDISTVIVGAEDNSSGWWSAFSDYFVVPTNKLLHLEFVNHGTGVDSWNNWNLAVTNQVADRDGDGYAEYFVLRSDGFGWGGAMVDEGYVFDAAMISMNYPDSDGDGDIWNDFRSTMLGAYVTLEVDHSATGNVYVTATAVGENGVELIETYQQPVSAVDNIAAFLICDGSYFEMKNAYLLPSKVTVVEDVLPISINVVGTPTSVEIGSEDFWGDAVATVIYADGSSAQVDTSAIAFSVVPDMTTLGEKTVIVAYNKTKQGEYCDAVTTLYTLEVTNSVASLEITSLPEITTYYFYERDAFPLNVNGLEVTAVYSDGSTGIVNNTELQFGMISALEGEQDVTITFEGATQSVSTVCPVTLVRGIAQVGATDFSTLWWTAFSPDINIAAGESKTISMYCYSSGLANWNSPSTILRKADLAEYAVVRMDNFGWGDGYETATATGDWDWDVFAQNISGSKIDITITNKGDNTADIVYNVEYTNGETHVQSYEGITVDSADVNYALVIEGAYVVTVE